MRQRLMLTTPWCHSADAIGIPRPYSSAPATVSTRIGRWSM